MITRYEKDKIIDAEYEEILEPIYDNMADEELNKEYNTEYVQLKRCWISYSKTFWGRLQYHLVKLYDTIQDGILTFIDFVVYKIKMYRKHNKTGYKIWLANIYAIMFIITFLCLYQTYDYQWCENTKECTNVK